MPSQDFEKLRAAYEAANDGDLEPLVELFTLETISCGVERGRLWWRKTPS